MAAAADTAVIAGKSPSATLLLLRPVVSFIFAFAALGKLFDLPDFQRNLSAVDWIPTSFILPSAILLILAELSAAILLWPRRTTRIGASLSAALSLAFTLYTAERLIVGASTDCACFGIFLKLNAWVMLVVDSVLLAASLGVLRRAQYGTIPKSVTKADPDTPSLRLPMLFAALLLCVWGFFLVLPHDPLLLQKVGSLLSFSQAGKVYNPITQGLLLRDPAMGTRLPIPSVAG